MPVVVPDVGERELLRKMIRDALLTDEGYTLRLYTAVAGGLTDATVAGDFTEATFSGYAARALTRAGWNAPVTSTGITSITYATPQDFGAGSPQTVLGYYVVGAVSGVLLWAEAFPTAKVLVAGDTLRMTPRLELS